MQKKRQEVTFSFLLSRVLSYLIDVSLSASVTLLLFSLNILSWELFIPFSVSISFVIWTLSEYLNEGRTIGREIVLNTEVVLSLLISVFFSVLAYPLIPDYVLFVFLIVLLLSLNISNFLDLEQVVLKEKIVLHDNAPRKVVVRNAWKSLAFYFFPLLFIDFVSIIFRNMRIIDFAEKNEVRVCEE